MRARQILPAWVLVSVCLSSLFSQAPSRRPLTHQDYDQWRTIQGQTLSRDGKYLAYALFPQDGDGEVVIRNLTTGEEQREPAGARPLTPPRADPESEAPPQLPGVRIAFTYDSAAVVFTTFPAKAETQKARKERRPAAEMPKNGLVIMELASGSAFRYNNVKSFQIPEKVGGWVAFLREAEPAERGTPAASATTDDEDQRGGARASAGAAANGPRPEYGTDLVLHRLSDHSERVLPSVVEYALSKDGKTLLYAVSSRQPERNGVYAVTPGVDQLPQALLSGKGKYSKVAFDDEQKLAVFLADRELEGTSEATPRSALRIARYHLYAWDRATAVARELVSPSTPGFPNGMLINDRAPITFSKDGQHVFFGYSKPSALRERPATPAGAESDEERVDVDLWHWKDDFIQPMQKVRAEADRRRAYRAVFHLSDNKLLALGGDQMEEVTPSENGLWALGSDTREYRRMVEYDTRYADFYLVDTRTGDRKGLLKKFASSSAPVWSPDASYVLYFDGKDWNTASTATGKSVNLTEKLGVKVADEEHDTPGAPPPYGNGGWSKDGKWVLVYDHYDIWRIAADGTASANLTAGAGRRDRIQFRATRLDPEDRWVDPAKPMLLRAENLENFETGFYQTTLDATEPPKKLVMSARSYGPPLKAKDADVYVVTASTFRDFPDLLVTDGSMREMRRVSAANPQQAQYTWGTAELIRFKNADGVPLKGILYKPDGFDPAKKYPLMVYIYERLSNGVNRYIPPAPMHSINVTYYVSNGYMVLLPDIVYTAGYPGQSALKCVLPAIQAVVDRGGVDENAIGIQGHSWGGYQIAYMITQTHRFRAVAAGAPVSNMVSAYDGIRWGPGLPRQFQYEKTQSRIGGSLWDYPMRFVENSPVFFADRVKTPLMMLHNDADDAVPWYQGIEYYLALRRLGKEVYLFTYNGEPHGIRRRANQKDYTVRLQQYFDYYLKGAAKPAWMEKGRPYLERQDEQERATSRSTDQPEIP